jgi:hypothetical protein
MGYTDECLLSSIVRWKKGNINESDFNIYLTKLQILDILVIYNRGKESILGHPMHMIGNTDSCVLLLLSACLTVSHLYYYYY